MPFFRKFSAGLSVHEIPEEQEFIIKMLYRFSKRTCVQASIGKCSCYSDCPHGIQAVSVLDDLSLYCIRSSALVSAERNRIDDPADSFNLIFRHGMLYQKRPASAVLCILQDGVCSAMRMAVRHTRTVCSASWPPASWQKSCCIYSKASLMICWSIFPVFMSLILFCGLRL